ncbi:MAG: glycosyltransferase family 2 protein [Selenomonadaceae bacterium]|nr:glycosyltransferase family 2 protein [Selenomonadaceae bacterium]
MQVEQSIDKPTNPFNYPAISVVIPMYNAEEYIEECLDSVLKQTFQNFEVIVVDDCSTDNSVAVVKNYAPKFGGRLKLAQTKENSRGGGYIPRNLGLMYSRGEYIFFADSDDYIVNANALEIMYKAAEDNKADVVYTAAYYKLNEQKEMVVRWDDERRERLKNKLEDKASLTVDAPANLLRRLLLIGHQGNFHAPWSKLVRRKLLIENKILFPEIITSGDFVWTVHLFCCSKRFLRIPAAFYYYRENFDSVTKIKTSSEDQLFRCIKAFTLGTKILKDLSNKMEVLRKEPQLLRAAIVPFFNNCLIRTRKERTEIPSLELYNVLYQKFIEENFQFDFALPFFFSVVDDYEKKMTALQAKEKELEELQRTLTARIDIKLVGSGNIKLISVSDDKAAVTQPDWIQKGGTGYVIESFAGKMKLAFKTDADGEVRLWLRGVDVRNPSDRSKRVPYWIDVANLIVNGEAIFDKITPVWHNEPYEYHFNAHVGKNIELELKWLPHR